MYKIPPEQKLSRSKMSLPFLPGHRKRAETCLIVDPSRSVPHGRQSPRVRPLLRQEALPLLRRYLLELPELQLVLSRPLAVHLLDVMVPGWLRDVRDEP